MSTKKLTGDRKKAVWMLFAWILAIAHGDAKIQFFETRLDPNYYLSYSPPPADAVLANSFVFYLPVDDKPKEAEQSR